MMYKEKSYFGNTNIKKSFYELMNNDVNPSEHEGSFKDSILNYCLNLLKREDVKNELKYLMKPMLDVIIQEIYPYIFLSLIFVVISFLLILGIFVLLLRYKIHNPYVK